MSDPERLLSSAPGAAGGASDFERELLGSWAGEGPSDAARAKVLAIAGASGAAVAVATAKAGVAAGGSIAPKAAATALVKWGAIGLLGLAAAGGTLAYLRAHRHVETPALAPASRIAAQPPSVPDAPVIAALAVAPVVPAVPVASPPVASEPHAPRRSPAPEKSARTADPALGEQVAALDHARRALASGDAAAAIRALDDDEARFPHGALVEEAEVLRVESLLAAGDRASAGRVGARFLAAHPGSPHAARVRALLGQTSAP